MDIKEDLNNAVKVLKEGGVILYPTDTVWGLGCDATNSEAVKRIFEIKQRIETKSMIVLVENIAAVERIVGEIPESAEQLIGVSVDPLTIIYDNARGLAKGVTADDGSVGIRITTEKFSNLLCKKFRRPIVSTSANISGHKNATTYRDIADEIKKSVDYIVEYRREDAKKSKPSGIIKVGSDNVIKIIR